MVALHVAAPNEPSLCRGFFSTSFKQVYHSVVRQLYRESAWMIVGDILLRSVLVLLSIYVFLFSVFSNIAPVWTTKVVADLP